MDVCSFARLFDSAFYQHFYLEMFATDNEYRTAFLTIATKTQIDCCCNDRETSEWKHENKPTLRCQIENKSTGTFAVALNGFSIL